MTDELERRESAPYFIYPLATASGSVPVPSRTLKPAAAVVYAIVTAALGVAYTWRAGLPENTSRRGDRGGRND